MYIIFRNVNQINNFINRVKARTSNKCTILRSFCEKVVDTNTNVAKDVILYKYINDRNFKIANLFAICQFGFWSYLSLFSFNTLRDVPVPKSDDNAVWWRKINLGEQKYRNGLIIISFSIGFGVLALTWMYTLRSVKYLILRKGGQEVTVITHTPFGENRMFTKNLKYLNCRQMRSEAKSQLPIKIKGHLMHYILDMKGEFKHPLLFDSTCGLSRKLK